MARFNADDVDHYGGSGGAGYFSLKNDKEVARVRFMYDSVDDVEGFAVHEVEVDGKKRYVNCLREYGQPLDNCPFCKAGKFQVAKLFVPLYSIDEDKVLVWDRGKKFFAKISSICGRYQHLVSHTFEIERNGAKGDTNTTYEIYETGQDETTLEDLPEMPEILGNVVLDKTAEEMEYYLDTNEFPENDSTGGDAEPPVRRRESAAPNTSSGRNSRRTPATAGRSGRREAF